MHSVTLTRMPSELATKDVTFLRIHKLAKMVDLDIKGICIWFKSGRKEADSPFEWNRCSTDNDIEHILKLRTSFFNIIGVFQNELRDSA